MPAWKEVLRTKNDNERRKKRFMKVTKKRERLKGVYIRAKNKR